MQSSPNALFGVDAELESSQKTIWRTFKRTVIYSSYIKKSAYFRFFEAGKEFPQKSDWVIFFGRKNIF